MFAARSALAVSRSSIRTMNVSRSAVNNAFSVNRSIHSTALRMAGGGPPIIQGEGSAPGEVPTDESQSTGLERFELLGKLQGVDVFDMKPLESSRLGTKKDPILVQSLVCIFDDAIRMKYQDIHYSPFTLPFFIVPFPYHRLHRISSRISRYYLDPFEERTRLPPMP